MSAVAAWDHPVPGAANAPPVPLGPAGGAVGRQGPVPYVTIADELAGTDGARQDRWRAAALEWVFAHSASKGPARAVALALAAGLGPSGDVLAGFATIADRAGLATSTAQTAVRKLVDLGEVRCMESGGRGRGGRGHANRYCFVSVHIEAPPAMFAVPNMTGHGTFSAEGTSFDVPNGPGAGHFTSSPTDAAVPNMTGPGTFAGGGGDAMSPAAGMFGPGNVPGAGSPTGPVGLGAPSPRPVTDVDATGPDRGGEGFDVVAWDLGRAPMGADPAPTASTVPAGPVPVRPGPGAGAGSATPLPDRVEAELTARLASVCQPPPSVTDAALRATARRAVRRMLEHLDWHVVDEVIGYMASLREPPRGPVYALVLVNEWRADRGWTHVPELRLDDR